MTMPTLAALAALTIALAVAAPAGAQSASGARPATLTVEGAGSVARAPDRAVVSFRIETNSEQSAAATSANSAISNALIKRLALLNIPATAIATAGYSLDYTPRPAKPDPASTQRYGFTVDRTIDATVDNVDGAGAVVDAGVAAGVTNVNGVAFSLRDPGAAQRSAQAAAVADASAQARGLATAAHVRLVRILSIATAGAAAAPAPRLMMSALAVPTTIDPGTLSVNATVTIRYEIAPE